MLTIHHLGISQSDRVVWLCEELAIPYDLVRYDRDPQTRLAPPEYRALHPIGTAPVITDGDLTLAESGAVVDYIIHRHGNGRLAIAPSDAAYPDYLFWFHYANGSLMPAAMAGLIARLSGGEEANVVAGSITARFERGLAMIEQRLGDVPFFAGQTFSAADIMSLFPLTTMRVFAPLDITPYPNVRAYLQRIAKRPAFQRAMRKADPDFVVPMT